MCVTSKEQERLGVQSCGQPSLHAHLRCSASIWWWPAAVASRARGTRVGSRPEGSAALMASPSFRAALTRSRIGFAAGSATPQRAAETYTVVDETTTTDGSVNTTAPVCRSSKGQL